MPAVAKQEQTFQKTEEAPKAPKEHRFIADDYKNEVIKKAWTISGGNKDFILTLAVENGAFTPDRRHNPAGNAVGVDWGFCGINSHYNGKVLRGEGDLRKNPEKQLEWCWTKYRDTCNVNPAKRCTYFYGHNSRLKNKLGIEFPNH